MRIARNDLLRIFTEMRHDAERLDFTFQNTAALGIDLHAH